MPFFNKAVVSDINIIYFSFITSATVGFGDLYTTHPTGQILVVTELLVSIVFITLFINFFTSKIQNPTYRGEETVFDDAASRNQVH